MLLYLLIAGYVYFFPSILAVIVRHANPAGVFFVNLAIAWTFIGWFLVLAWVFDRQKTG